MQTKYLVMRRDGSIPEWPWFVLGAGDPAAGHALATYHATAERNGVASSYLRRIAEVENAFRSWIMGHGQIDPSSQDLRRSVQFVSLLMQGRPGIGAGARLTPDIDCPVVNAQLTVLLHDLASCIEHGGYTDKWMELSNDVRELTSADGRDSVRDKLNAWKTKELE